jgi:hypothetical protein
VGLAPAERVPPRKLVSGVPPACQPPRALEDDPGLGARGESLKHAGPEINPLLDGWNSEEDRRLMYARVRARGGCCGKQAAAEGPRRTISFRGVPLPPRAGCGLKVEPGFVARGEISLSRRAERTCV